MFGFVQQIHVLKTRVLNTFFFTLRNSLRFNSTLALERSQPHDSSLFQVDATGSGAHLEKAVKKVRTMRGKITSYKKKELSEASQQSPWFLKICAFDECLSQSVESSLRHKKNALPPKQSTLFWDSVAKAMNLYRDLQLTPDLKSQRVSNLLNLLHTALRVNRSQLTSLNKKPDYDSQSFYKEMTNYLCDSLREVWKDISLQTVEVTNVGALHLIDSFKELLLFEEAVDIWNSAVNSEHKSISKPFMNPAVVGAVLPLLHEQGKSFADVKCLYEKLVAKKNTCMDPGLTLGMIRTSLAADKTNYALQIFQDFCTRNVIGISRGVLTNIHLVFIGECKDLVVAKTFFERAVNCEFTYKMSLQVSSVKKLLQNVWDATHDINQICELWVKASKYYGKNVVHGISSSFNSKFFSIFFENYMNDKAKGITHLRKLIDIYHKIKPLDETFFNIVLTKCTVWKDRDIIESIEKSYAHYSIPRTIVSFRILLKAMGSIEVSDQEIFDRWLELLLKADQIGNSYIANADWAALRDATISYVDVNAKNQEIEKVNYTNYESTLETAKIPAFKLDISSQSQNHVQKDQYQRIEAENRIELYFKITKRYGQFCRDPKQFSRIIIGISKFSPMALSYVQKFEKIDTNDIHVPKFNNLKKNI